MTPTLAVRLESLDDTRALAEALAPVLAPGDTVALEGDLGAGKTTLVRMLVEALGIDPAPVSSPTYVVMQQYGDPGPGRDARSVAHIDAYRLR